MQELRGGDRRGDEVGLGQAVDAHPLELAQQVQRGLLGVVRQEQERDVVVAHVRHEVLGAGDQLLAPVDDPVHVGDHAEPAHVRPFRRCPDQASPTGGAGAWRAGRRVRLPELRCIWDAPDALRCTSDAHPSQVQRNQGDPRLTASYWPVVVC